MSDLAFYSGTFKTLRGLESLAQDTNDVWDIRWQRFSQSAVTSVCAINKQTLGIPWNQTHSLYTFGVCFIYWRLCYFMHFMKCLFSKSVIQKITLWQWYVYTNKTYFIDVCLLDFNWEEELDVDLPLHEFV